MSLSLPNSFFRFFTVCIASIAVTGLFSTVAYSQTKDKNATPEIGVVAADVVSLDKEMLIGEAMMRQLRAQAPLVFDPVLQQYIQDLGNRLVVHANNANFPFEFFIINNNAINAFAFFGGHVGMHTGLIARADSESEIASVLAHEVAHVTQRHIARSIQARQRSSPLAIASLIGGLLIALADPQAGVAAIQASSAASAQLAINYTRSNEQEADRIGISLLSRAGFDPRGADSFFSKLAAETRLVSKPPERLLTHPLTENRISDVRTRLNSLPARNLPPSLAFHLAKARILARYTYEQTYSLEYFKNAVGKRYGVIEEAAQYGYALALYRNEEYEKALSIIQPLLNKRPNNPFYLDSHTDIQIALENFAVAAQTLYPHYEKAPGNPVLALNLANTFVEGRKGDKAVEILRDYLLIDKDNYLAHQLLSEAYLTTNEKGLMHQSKAEAYALVGGYQRAIDELQFAYNYSKDDHLSKQRVRARIQQFRDEIKRLQTL